MSQFLFYAVFQNCSIADFLRDFMQINKNENSTVGLN